MNNESTIIIKRDPRGKLESVSAVMPVWEKETDNGVLKIVMPFLGVKFHVFGGMDVNEMCHDAVKGFCLMSERHGLGLEAELIALGWEEKSKGLMMFRIQKDNFVFEQIVNTGDNIPQFIDFVHEPELAHHE